VSNPGGWADPIHDSWEELVVGQAVAALEPEDEEALTLHVRGCARCERLLLETEISAAELAYAPSQVAAPERLRRRVALIAGAESRPTVIPGAARRQRRGLHIARGASGRPWLLVVCGVIVAIAVSLWNLVLQSDNAAKNTTISRMVTVLQCVDDSGCQQVRLAAEADTTRRGVLLVRGSHATLVLDGISPNDRSATTYVLWQQPLGAKPPVAVDRFDLTCHTVCVIDQRFALKVPFALTEQFLVTFEAGRNIPTVPTSAIVSSRVSSTS
jgi:hypothetical protein